MLCFLQFLHGFCFFKLIGQCFNKYTLSLDFLIILWRGIHAATGGAVDSHNAPYFQAIITVFKIWKIRCWTNCLILLVADLWLIIIWILVFSSRMGQSLPSIFPRSKPRHNNSGHGICTIPTSDMHNNFMIYFIAPGYAAVPSDIEFWFSMQWATNTMVLLLSSVNIAYSSL